MTFNTINKKNYRMVASSDPKFAMLVDQIYKLDQKLKRPRITKISNRQVNKPKINTSLIQ